MAKHTVKEIPFWDGVQLHQPGAVVEYVGKPSKNLERVKDRPAQAQPQAQPQAPAEGDLESLV